MDKKVKIWFQKFKIPTLVISLFLLIGVIIMIGISFADPNSGYLKNQVVEDLSFENAKLDYVDGISTFTVEVYNESDNDYYLKYISINFTDQNNKVTTLIGYVGDSLVSKEGKLITASIDQDLSSSVSLEYVVNK